MQRVFRPLAVFTIATAVSLAAGLRSATLGGAAGSEGGDVFHPGYDLAELELVKPTLYHVDQSYVDDARIDWNHMVLAGLDAVERLVPSVLFTPAEVPDTLAIEIGDYKTVLDLPHVDDAEEAEKVLTQVAVLLSEHLSPRDVPDGRAEGGATGGPRMARVEYALINGMLSTLDPHSLLLPPEAAREMDLDNQGEFGGLGITIVLDDEHDQLMVECPIPGTPAWNAGVKPGDRVVRIDGESTLNMSLDDAIALLRGPVGRAVHLEVVREGAEEPVVIAVKRALIDSNPVESALLEGNIGWVRIQSFHEKVGSDVVDALGTLRREAGQDLSGLILDLRGNPGGFLTQAVRVADLFLESGDIVSTVDGTGRETEPPEVATRPAEPDYPMVVLVDASSASASEIVAGALRYNERAVIVGERTFGKGSVQNLHTFYDDSKLKLTISRYLTPGERSIQAVGIPADIALEPSVFVPDGAVRLFQREHLRREADLEAALERTSDGAVDSAYHLRYVAAPAGRSCVDGPQEKTDRELAFSRLLLLSVGDAWRRPDVLAAAGRVVANQSRAWSTELEASFKARGIDWVDGAPGPRDAAVPPVRLTLGVGDDGALDAGADESVTLAVTNTTDRPLYRVAAVLNGDDLLSGQEFFFGRIDAGEVKTWTVPVHVDEGVPSERTPVHVSVRDAGPGELAGLDAEVEVRSRPLPVFAWSVTTTEAGGDGDGVLDPGEELHFTVAVENIGVGPAPAPYVRIRNHSGRAAELGQATFEPGPLPPGARVEGVLTAKVGSGDDLPPIELALELGDASAYDRGSVLRAGMYEWFGQREILSLVPGEPLPVAVRHVPPTIDVTREPALVVDGDRATVSGLVGDDHGLAEVMVFVGDDKVFFEGRRSGTTFRSVPFTADVPLAPGANTVAILARDDDGFVSSRSLVVWSGDGAVLAKAAPE